MFFTCREVTHCLWPCRNCTTKSAQRSNTYITSLRWNIKNVLSRTLSSPPPTPRTPPSNDQRRNMNVTSLRWNIKNVLSRTLSSPPPQAPRNVISPTPPHPKHWHTWYKMHTNAPPMGGAFKKARVVSPTAQKYHDYPWLLYGKLINVEKCWNIFMEKGWTCPISRWFTYY